MEGSYIGYISTLSTAFLTRANHARSKNLRENAITALEEYVLSPSERPKGLLEVRRERMRLAHMSMVTENNYVGWLKSYISFHGKRHPREMGTEEITQFLSYLASEKGVSAATQNQALNAVVFLYKHVLDYDPGTFEGIVRAKQSKFIPEVLSVEEISRRLDNLKGILRLHYSQAKKLHSEPSDKK